jgi:hypothetical protein
VASFPVAFPPTTYTRSSSIFSPLGRLSKESVQVRGSIENFVTNFYGEGLLAPRSTPKLEDHPLSAVCGCLFDVFAANLDNWRPSLYPKPKDTPCCGDRDPPNILSKIIYKVLTLLSTWSEYGSVSEEVLRLDGAVVTGKELTSIMEDEVGPWEVLLFFTTLLEICS